MPSPFYTHNRKTIRGIVHVKKSIVQFVLLSLLGVFSFACVQSSDSANNTQAIRAETKGLIPQSKIKAVILDGQNNHFVWPLSTQMMKRYLEDTGLFVVDIYRTQPMWHSTGYQNVIAQYPLNDNKIYEEKAEPEVDASFSPLFSQYDVVISNLGWKTADWPMATKISFEQYMKTGGGFVSIHAADNTFGDWQEFNKMIGVGGWGGRNESHGPYIYYNKENQLIRDNSAGGGGAHGPVHKFTVQTRFPTHPIMEGLPSIWKHTEDELYEKLRGPAENMTILASAYPQYREGGNERHEPVLMTIDYYEGRVFHSTLGHDHRGFEGVGFITTFVRGTEWAATGKVTIPVPADFPTQENATRRVFER